jgi:thioredoxin-related protein
MTPAGEQSSPAAWAARLRIARVPTLVFFDEAGEEVFRLDSLVLRQRMERALRYVLEKAYLQGKTYQQFTREKTIEKLKAQRAPAAAGD